MLSRAPRPSAKFEPVLQRDAEAEEPLPPPPPPPPPPAPPGTGGMAQVTAQLKEMGFSQDIAQEAAVRFPSGMEEAMEWALEESTRKAKESAQALGSLTRRLAEPKRPHPLTRAETAEVSPQVEAASAAAGRALESKLSKLVVLSELTGRRPESDGYRGDAELVAQLLGLGFSSDGARAAAERCSTVEAAVAWLTDCRE
eukprot:s392_g3.t1